MSQCLCAALYHLTFLTTAFGKPFVAAGFTNWFREACNEAGLPRGTSAHGLRKAGCRRLAEAGCSANVIASISGHASLAKPDDIADVVAFLCGPEARWLSGERLRANGAALF